MNIRILGWFFCFVFWTGMVPVWAQEPAEPQTDADVRAALEKAGGAEENGGADLVTVFKRTRVEVEDSGLAHVHNRELIKCLSEKGAAEMARLRLDYDPTSNMIEVRSLRVFRQGGAVETLSGEKTVDLPQPQGGIYWGARMKLIPLPRLAPGDAVEIVTYLKGFLIAYLGPEGDDEKYIPPMRGHFYDVVTFEENRPVKLRHYAVSTPLNKPVQYEVYNGEVQSAAGFDADRLTYRFWKENLAPLKLEPKAVAASDVQTKVVLATVPDWKEKSRWFAQVNDPQFAADDAIRAKVQELTRGLTKDTDKIAAIVHWVADNIRYSGITMGKGEGYTLHSGSMIYNDRSGVCKDKAGLAITMLRALGYKVWPAMIMAGARVERIPADQFNHCVAALEKPGGGYELLDPTWVPFSTEVWSSAEGEQNYLIGSPAGEDLMITPAFEAAENKIRIESNAVIGEDGSLTGTLVISGKGVADQRLRRELVHVTAGRDRQAWFEKAVASLGPGAVVEPVALTYSQIQDVSRPLRLEVKYKIPRFAIVRENGLLFSPPNSRHLLRQPSLFPYLGSAGPEKRTQPLQFGAPRMLEVAEKIVLPPGFKVVRLPANRTLEGPAASLATQLTSQGGALVFDYQVVIKRRVVPVADYANFRKVVQEAEKLPEDLIVLERAAERAKGGRP